MFGVNYFGQPEYAQGYSTIVKILIEIVNAATKFVSGFKRSTRREL